MPLRRNVSVGADRKIIAAILMTSSALASVAGASGAFAQTVVSSAMTADQSKSFSIPAGSLAKTLTSFGAQSGKQVSVETSVIQGLSSPGVAGLMTAQQALTQLLAGTGLTYRLSGNVVTLVKAAANITLGPVRVGGTFNAHAAAIGPGNGYVATYTDAGTKTDTPLWEIPNSVYVITKQEIQDQQAQNIQEALRYMPGVVSEQTGTANNGNAGVGGSFIQRGFNSTQYIDGIQSKSRSAGETAFVERVEALNGPASVMYGQTSPGGIVATRLKQPTDTPIRNVSVGFGNWGRYEATFDVSDKVTKSGNVKYRIAGIGVTQGTQTDYVSYHRVGILPSIKWDIDPATSLTLLGSYMYTPGDGMYTTGYPLLGTLVKGSGGYIPRSRFLGEPTANITGEKEARFEYQFSHKFNRQWEFQQTFSYESSESWGSHLYQVGSLAQNNTVMNRWANKAEQPSHTIGLDSRFVGHVSTGPLHHTLVAGMDFRQVKVEQNLYYDHSAPSINIWDPVYTGWTPNYSLSGNDQIVNSDAFQTLNQKGIYFQDQIKFHKLTVTIGGRQDWYGYDMSVYGARHIGNTYVARHLSAVQKEPASAFTWRAGFTYNFDFGLTPYFSYATSFMPQVGYFDAAGKLFKPNQGDQFEAGLKYLIPHSDIFLTAAAYHIKEDHYAITDTINPGYQVDAGTVVSKGVELSAHANITKDLHLTASYSFNDTRVAKSDTVEDRTDVYGNVLGEVSEKGKYISGLPRNMVNMFIDYTPPARILHGFGVNFGVRYIGTTYADNANSFKAPAYTLFDVGAHYDFSALTPTLKGLKAQLAISNLTNKRYITSCSGGGGACYFGQGQRIYGNLSYSW